MKNNTKSMYVVCLVACIMALLNINYADIYWLDIAVVVTVITAIIAITYNYFTNRKK